MGYYAVPNESLNLQLELERISVVYKITSQNSEGNLTELFWCDKVIAFSGW